MSDERNELFIAKVSAGNRTYFFDVKESKDGTRYLVISESKHSEPDHPHNRVMVFQEHFRAFRQAYDEAAVFLGADKEVKKLDEIRRKHPKAYSEWTGEEDIRLRERFTEGFSVTELARVFQRQESAIRSRLSKLGL